MNHTVFPMFSLKNCVYNKQVQLQISGQTISIIYNLWALSVSWIGMDSGDVRNLSNSSSNLGVIGGDSTSNWKQKYVSNTPAPMPANC